MKLTPGFLESLKDMYAHANEPEALSLLSTFYWRSLLLLFFVCLVAAFTWGIWTLAGVLGAIGTSSNKLTLPPSPLNRTQLQQTLDAFAQRSANFDALVKNGTPFSDPSR